MEKSDERTWIEERKVCPVGNYLASVASGRGRTCALDGEKIKKQRFRA